MSGVLIPTGNDPFYTQRVRLDGVDYRLRISWRTRGKRWVLDIFTDEDELIVAGLVIETNRPLLRWHHFDDRLPDGEIIAVARTDDTSAPGLDELGEGKRVELTYYPVVSDG